MSSSVWLARRSAMVGDSSLGSLSTAAMTCERSSHQLTHVSSIGVRPVPPAIIPSLVQAWTTPPLRKRPRPRYSCAP
eukprot:scaffold43797_cov27-Phaeocystis_antarctica.AAC.1